MASALIDDWFIIRGEPSTRGVNPAELAAAERRLGLALPRALRDWHLLLGALSEVWNVQDRLLAPDGLRAHAGRLEVATENQGVVTWSIALADIALPDPPVWVSDQQDAEVHHPAASSVTEFALQLLALNAKFSDRELLRANGQASDAAIEVLSGSLPRLPFGDLHWPPYPTRLYGTEGLVAEVDCQTWIWLTALDPHAFDRHRHALKAAGIEWEHVEVPR